MKHWYQSKTIWGGITAIIAAALALMGIDLSEIDRATLEAAGIAIAGGLGGIASVYGRVKHKGKITK